jgi:glycosyltransferase involved in cell wall biosynthesis
VNERLSLAFYAPLKAPDHAVPSGDRRMAQLLMKALETAGFAPFIASQLRSHDKTGDSSVQRGLMRSALAEAEVIAAHFAAAPPHERPRLWFTYHVYYKAPDWIGSYVARKLAIPYVVAEGSRAPKRKDGPWQLGHAAAEAALDQAKVIFVVNDADRPMLESAMPASQRLVDLRPFIDVDEGCAARQPAVSAPPRLLTVAMMRHGDKLSSYRLMAAALQRIADRPWTLTVAGDGEARPQVEKAFAPLGERVTFLGLVEDAATLARLYAASDLFVWPAVNEAYGMVLLEAQSRGCPVVAGRFGGVPNVVRDGETGLLTPPGDVAALAAAVAALLDDPARRRTMGSAAEKFVCRERTVAQAARVLRDHLAPLVA